MARKKPNKGGRNEGSGHKRDTVCLYSEATPIINNYNSFFSPCSEACSEALQAMREEIDGKLVGLERVVVDTR